MKKLKFVKVVVPEVAAYTVYGNNGDNVESDYRCPVCGMEIEKAFMSCPYCSSEFAWDKIEKPKNKEFQKLLDSL